MGFQHIRIPVRWFNPNGTDNRLDNLDENLLEEVVTYAIRKGFYVIMNDHHNNWMMNGYNDTAVFNEAVRFILNTRLPCANHPLLELFRTSPSCCCCESHVNLVSPTIVLQKLGEGFETV